MKDYRPITPEEKEMWANKFNSVMTAGFDEAVSTTYEWLSSPEVADYFYNQRGLLNTFFETSGINKQWRGIIERRAEQGVDVTKQIFDYARSVDMEDYLVEYTDTERRAFNRLCDYNYELIVGVTQDEIMAIRRKLLQDYAEGRHPTQTALRELQLQPINGWSPQERAVVIARTESARTLNTSRLETMHADGVKMVLLHGCDITCKECMKYNLYPTPIEEAMEMPVPHPRCTGSWVSYNEEYVDERLQYEGVTREEVLAQWQ